MKDKFQEQSEQRGRRRDRMDDPERERMEERERERMEREDEDRLDDDYDR
ncbi:hypothetical protein [Streptomyces luteolifulvus]|jgi:hypothetical protein|nr:hypothetical protein [Streptomyces luteolifulvus]